MFNNINIAFIINNIYYVIYEKKVDSMKQITKTNAKKFFKSQGFTIMKSVVLKDIDTDDYDHFCSNITHIKITKNKFIKQKIKQDYIIWKKNKVYGFWNKWKQELIDYIRLNNMNRARFKVYCKQNNLDFEKWI